MSSTATTPADTNSSSTPTFLDAATAACTQVLAKNFTAKGVVASVDNYPQVWTRDTAIAAYGALALGDDICAQAVRVSLETLESYQDRFGQIPFFVRVADDLVRYGHADSNPWYVIAACHYAETTGDIAWLEARADKIAQAFDYCEMRDFSKRHLIESRECDDWADLLCNRGCVLFPNVLHVHALRQAARLLAGSSQSEAWAAKADIVREAIRDRMWVRPHGTYIDKEHEQIQMAMTIRMRRAPYFIPWFGSFMFGERFDTPANLLAILSGVADAAQTESILDFIDQTGLDDPFPVRVLHPPIQPGEDDWRDYYRVWGNNLPDRYHNGGIWPWVGGLYVATLAHVGRHERAQRMLKRLAEALEQGKTPWECNEWLHGLTGKPMGAKYQAWSAGMFLYARNAVERGHAPGFSKIG